MSDALTDRDRYPTLTPAGREMLAFLREHPHAPLYRNESGNRLESAEVIAVRDFETAVLRAHVGWPAGGRPAWLDGFVHDTFATVPFYRALGVPSLRFEDLPTISRADLAADIARFVPDSIAVERLINFRTTGTTGHPMIIASLPVVAARYLAFHKRALRRFGIELNYGRGKVGVVLVGYQRKCFTYVSVTPTMDDSGLAKLNLHPHDWRDPADRARYLDALAPEVYAGDPLSFAELAQLSLTTRPRALISVSMALSVGLRRELEARFACPVLDVYSMNEAGPIGVFDPALGGHVLLQPHLYVEILDERGRTVATGERGEITLTGGFNECLPLLRYRTGDHAALDYTVEGPLLRALAGRRPIRFRTQAGEWLNNIDVTHALNHLPLSQFRLHQTADASLVLSVRPGALALRAELSRALLALFGATQPLTIETLTADDKVLQYTSDLAGATP